MSYCEGCKNNIQVAAATIYYELSLLIVTLSSYSSNFGEAEISVLLEKFGEINPIHTYAIRMDEHLYAVLNLEQQTNV